MPNRQCRQIIQHQYVVLAAPDTSVREASRRMAESKVGSILVCDGDKLVGIFTERDLLNRVVAEGRDLDATPLSEVMTPDPDTIQASDQVRQAIRMMDEFGYRHLPVMDDGKAIGVVSIRDLPMADMVEMQPELEDRHALSERIW